MAPRIKKELKKEMCTYLIKSVLNFCKNDVSFILLRNSYLPDQRSNILSFLLCQHVIMIKTIRSRHVPLKLTFM